MKIRKTILLIWLSILFTAIGLVFWRTEFLYGLPTPIPENYQPVKQGRVILIPGIPQPKDNKPVFLHFFNPTCPCSKFNITHFKALVKQYGDDVTFAIVVMSNTRYTARQIQDKFDVNIPVYFEPKEFERNGKKFFIGHGDGLGPGDHGYKRLKKVFRNPACQWLFGVLPPYVGMGLANYMSRRSRAQTGASEEVFLGENNEWLIIFCNDRLNAKFFDYFIFGHRHLPIDYRLKDNSRYINLGDWIRYFTYAEFDGQDLILKSYTGNDHKIIRNE